MLKILLGAVAVRLSTDKDLVALPFQMAITCNKYNTPIKTLLNHYEDIEPT